MSATNRGSERQKDDFYETQAWCVRALLKTVNLPSGVWFEPAYGTGAIVKAATEAHEGSIDWYVNDINVRWLEDRNVKYFNHMYDAEGMGCDCFFDVVITNPPFNQALDFVKGALKDGKIVVMLLRLNWLASKARNSFLIDNQPSVYVLPRRPSFTDDGKTDATDYAWFVWGMDSTPVVRVIAYEVCK